MCQYFVNWQGERNMETFKIFLKKHYRVLLVILLALIFAGISSSLIGDNVKIVMNDYNNYKKYGGEEHTYSYSDLAVVDYMVNGQSYTSLTKDPQLIINGVNQYISSINISFVVPVTQDIPIEIYWGIEGEGFAQERVLTCIARNGEHDVMISLGEKVTDLRLDIGTSENISFELSSVTVNEGNVKSLTGGLVNCIKENINSKRWFDYFQFIFFATVFVLLHFVVNIKEMYYFIFRKRWLITGIILLFMVVNRYHGDSISCYDYYIQPGIVSDYSYPVLGKERHIRSDEWNVDTPINLSTQYLENPYGKYNNLVRGTNTLNSNMLTVIYILNPVNVISILIRYIFGYEYAFSYGWYVNIFLAFLFQLELFLIISSRKKLLSVCGTCMVVLSSHYLWWGFPSLILYSSVALVCAYYFFKSQSIGKRVVYAYGTALGAASFVLVLYPAWEIPMGFCSAIIFIWIVHECWNDIKRMTKLEWIVFISALVLCIIMVAQNMIAQREYMKAITNTIYPGKRVDYGGFSFGKLANYITAVLYPYIDYNNPSEKGMYITLFPLPIFMTVYAWLKGNKKNWLLNGLIIVSIFLICYTTVGLPSVLARITLMTNSTAARAVDILGYIQVILFVVILSNLDIDNRINRRYAIMFAIIMPIIALSFADYEMPDYMSGKYKIIIFGILVFIFYSCIANTCEYIYKIGLLSIILLAVVTSIYVRPIVKGLDAIYSKPVAKEIQKIISEDGDTKWIACSDVMVPYMSPQFALACGAPVINSVNKYPNMDLWEKIDPNKSMENVYNRYAHFAVNFTNDDTSVECIYPDEICLNLSYKDIKKTEVGYVFSIYPLEVDNEYVTFGQLYGEYGSYIYKVQYH